MPGHPGRRLRVAPKANSRVGIAVRHEPDRLDRNLARFSICRGWRRERDSNPRYGFPYTRFPSVRLQPLGHLSKLVSRRTPSYIKTRARRAFAYIKTRHGASLRPQPPLQTRACRVFSRKTDARRAFCASAVPKCRRRSADCHRLPARALRNAAGGRHYSGGPAADNPPAALEPGRAYNLLLLFYLHNCASRKSTRKMRKRIASPAYTGTGAAGPVSGTRDVGRQRISAATGAQRRSRAVRHRLAVAGRQPQRGAARRR